MYIVYKQTKERNMIDGDVEEREGVRQGGQEEHKEEEKEQG